MAGYLSDFDDVDDDFEYDGRPYRFEPEYTDEQREEQLAREQHPAVRPRMLTGGALVNIAIVRVHSFILLKVLVK